MNRKKLKRGVGGSGERWIGLPHYLVKSRAWRSLPSEAKALLIEVWVRHNGVNNGEISYSCSEGAEALNCSKATVWRMFEILVDRGFLVVMREAHFRSKYARSWRITAERHNGKPATKDYMRWRPQKDSTSFTDETHSFTHETPDDKLTPTVPPVKLKRPKSGPPQFHPRNTYKVPWDERAAPMSADWKPRRATIRAAVEDGLLRYGDVSRSVAQFRQHEMSGGTLSPDWDPPWLNHLRTTAATKGVSRDHATNEL